MKRISRSALGLYRAYCLALVLPLVSASVVWAEEAKKGAEDPVPEATVAAAAERGATLKVLSLNVAHGRGDGRNQALQKTAAIREHLGQVADVLRREKPDVVGLQEADGASAWSGEFDHVAELARLGEFSHRFRGEHVQSMGLSYGTALLSRFPLVEPRSKAFAPSRPTPNKGFVRAEVAWPGTPELRVEITSLHLDFARNSVRRKQIDELATELAGRQRLRIVMGDFNAGWSDEHSPVKALAERLKLAAWKPDDREPTFGKKQRLDWVLVSGPLEFVECKVLPDQVSDHRAVVAVIKVGKPKAAQGPAKDSQAKPRSETGR
jgi:endonuclease/exonuclease/phosphatase family metal-dependent hydrolase